MAGNAAQGVGADMAFTYMPVAVNTRVVCSARIVEVNRANTFQPDRFSDSLNKRLQTIFLAYVVTGGERMRRIETNAERNFRTESHDLLKMFETMTDAVALARGVLQQYAK